jgi:hypothetical protein
MPNQPYVDTFQVLKLYAWEPSFKKKVLDIRDSEMNALIK